VLRGSSLSYQRQLKGGSLGLQRHAHRARELNVNSRRLAPFTFWDGSPFVKNRSTPSLVRETRPESIYSLISAVPPYSRAFPLQSENAHGRRVEEGEVAAPYSRSPCRLRREVNLFRSLRGKPRCALFLSQDDTPGCTKEAALSATVRRTEAKALPCARVSRLHVSIHGRFRRQVQSSLSLLADNRIIKCPSYGPLTGEESVRKDLHGSSVPFSSTSTCKIPQGLEKVSVERARRAGARSAEVF